MSSNTLCILKKSIIIIALSIWAGCLISQTANPLDPLQGGENVASAFIIAGPLPFNSSGTTLGYADDYDEVCPYTGSTAPDVVYAFSPAAGITVDIDLCGSSFDTKLYIYENAVTPGFPLDCNDDFYFDAPCGVYVSKIEGLFLTGGNTYFIIIDGYSEFDYGDYILAISEFVPPPACVWGVDVLCPEGAGVESETCGADVNGGCDMAPGTETWETVSPAGGTFCCTTWADGGNRDTDWFELTLTEASTVLLSADADQLIMYGLVTGGTAGYEGNPDCLTITGVSPSNTAGPCDMTFLDLGILDPGTYWFFTAMTVYNDHPCDNHYWIDFDITAVTCPPPMDLAAANITTADADLSWTESGSAIEWEYQLGFSGFTPAVSGTATLLNPLPVTGLSENTDYDYYVRSFCDPEYSEWEGPFGFSTLCDPVTTLPWAEDFEAAWPPDCWTDQEAADYGWSQSTYGAARSGTEWAYCNLAGAILTSPQFTLSSGSVLAFWFRTEDSNYPQSFKVKVGNNVIYEVTDATNETYESVQISLVDFTGQTISVSFNGETGTGGLDFGVCIDDVSVKEFNTWIGNTSVWNSSANWSTGTVPSQADPVFIPSVPSGGNYPVISGGITGECDFIAISPGATLQVINGNNLEVTNP
jgi:hypothetical protein